MGIRRGGALLVSDDGATNSFTTSFAALGGSITIPLAGDYDVGFGATVYGSNGTLRDYYLKAATSAPANTTDALQGYTNDTGPGRDGGFRYARLTGLTASSTLQIYGKGQSGTSYTYQRHLTVTPIRVG